MLVLATAPGASLDDLFQQRPSSLRLFRAFAGAGLSTAGLMMRCRRQGIRGGYLLAGRVTGATEPPPRSRAPPASHAMTLRVTLDPAGEPAARSQGLPDEEIPPWGRLAGEARHQAGQLDSEAGQMFDKAKAEK